MKQDRHGDGGNEASGGQPKPGDAAQPGEASPVTVAPHPLERCRGEKPQESGVHATARLRPLQGEWTVRLGSYSGAERSSGEDSSNTKIFGDLGHAGRPRRPASRGAKVREGSPNPYGDTACSGKTLKDP